MKKIGLFSLAFAAIFAVFAFTINTETTETKGESIKWVSFEEAVALNKKKKKKIFIDVYTDWCGWCKRMDANTFSHPAIAKYINEKYYAVKLNAEMKEKVVFGGKEYNFVAQGNRGYHELAANLLNGKLSYPTVVFLDEDFAMLTPVPGYRDAKGMEPLLKFFGEDNHKKDVDINQYIQNFKSSIE